MSAPRAPASPPREPTPSTACRRAPTRSQAFMDTRGYGANNAADPTGSLPPFGVGNANVTASHLTLTDPATVTVTHAPTTQNHGRNQHRRRGPVQAGQQRRRRSATSYTLQWSTNSGFASVADSQTFPATGNNVNVWFVNGLTNGSVYLLPRLRHLGRDRGRPLFRVSTARSRSDCPRPAAPSPAPSPLPARPAAPCMPASTTRTTTTPPLIFNTSPARSARRRYSLSVPTSTSAVYIPVAVIDQNNDGVIDPGDITNVNFPGRPHRRPRPRSPTRTSPSPRAAPSPMSSP